MNAFAANPERRRVICGVVIVVAILITFGRVSTHEFVGGWDDGPLIYDNPLINPPTAHSLAQIWQHAHARMYIPVVYSTWWTLASIGSVPDPRTGGTLLNPWVFHSANLIVHTISALLVFAILRRIVRNDLAACAGALLFAIHPLQAEAVAWATGMKDLLCGALALAAIWQYLGALDLSGAATKHRRIATHAMATALFVFAMLAKPAAVVVPCIALVIDVLLLDKSWRQSLRALWPWFALILPCLVWTKFSQPTPELIPPPLWQRPVIALDAIGFYVVKLLRPARLSIDYGLKPDVIVHTLLWVSTAVVAIGILLSRRRWLIASLAIFVLGVLPVLGLTPFVFQWVSTVADRYVYLSMLGSAIAAAFVIDRFPQPAARWIAATVLIALAAQSFIQAGYWADLETLSNHALSISPNSPAANNNVGDALFNRNEIQAAYEHFAKAVEAKPDYLVARDNLGVALNRLGRTDEAIDWMERTLTMRRSLPEPIRQPIRQDLERLTTLLRSRGRDAEADRHAMELRSLTPATLPAF